MRTAGFVVSPEQMQALAAQMGEQTLIARTGGAPSLAVGMAHIFSGFTSALGGKTATALWYHFAIMFEALFILTTIDAGTRVGRFMLQDVLRHVWPRFGETSWYPSIIVTSAAVDRGLGLLPLSGRGGSAGRDQLAVAAVRHLEPTAGGGRAVRRHDDHHQDGAAPATRG